MPDTQNSTESLACPGCGCMPGDGRTPTCFHPEGCGFSRAQAAGAPEQLDEEDEEPLEDLDGPDLLQRWQRKNKMHCLEGDAGQEKMQKLVRVLGYDGHQFRFGEPLQQFLSDNPGAMEAILTWVEEQLDDNQDWRANVIEAIEDQESGDEDD